MSAFRTRLPLLVAWSLLLAACATTSVTSTTGTEDPRPATTVADSKLADLAERYWAWTLETSPVWATMLGDRRFDDRLPDLSPGAHAANERAQDAFLAEARAIDVEGLGPARRVTLAVLVHQLEASVAGRVCKRELWDTDHLWGPQVWLGLIPGYQDIRDDEDIDQLAARYQAVPTLLGQYVENHLRGMSEGWTAPRVTVTRTIEQVRGFLGKPAADWALVTQTRWPDGWSDDKRAAGRARIAAAVEQYVVPAFRRWLEALEGPLLASSRGAGTAWGAGASELPAGVACYEAAVLQSTGTRKTADEIHAIGVAEVARLQVEMQAIAKEVSGSDDLAAFVGELRGRDDQIAKTADELLAVARDAVARAQARLPEAFGKLPTTPLEVRPLEAHRAPSSPAAFYHSAPEDGSRPAIYYLNTHNLPSRPLYTQDALAFHEAVPGHHLQSAIAREQTGLPAFQRNASFTAYVEGWALYAENLGHEFDLYATPLARFGALGFQSWRAVRLVVDTGLHAKGWTREQAIDYAAAHTPLSRDDVVVEIDRYITWPGQALGYMLGRMHIDAVRARAEQALGDRFDLRSFHDEVLRFGAVPLDVLDGIIDDWIRAQR